MFIKCSGSDQIMEREDSVSEVVISYGVHSWSSYSGDFCPERILENRPSDPKSRWLSEGNKLPQYLLLRLEQPAIVRHITFGKFEKSHACNLKKFQVSGGMDPEHMHLLYEGGLQNTSEPETFSLHCEVEGRPFPCQFIKISPQQSWGHTFNFSVWYVELWGEVEGVRVRKALRWMEEYRERQAVRLCLKHLRQFDYSEAFHALQKKARVQLEHPLLSQLHSLLVEKGDFEAAERLMEQAAEDGFLEDYVSSQPIEARWTPIEPAAKGGGSKREAVRPGMRGGHQMCIDPTSEVLWLFGGWDGSRDLGDLWKFEVRAGYWTCLCQDTSLVGGPSARSCHKMCLDVEGQVLYLLGRYLDPAARALYADIHDSIIIPGDFYSFCIDTQTWSLVSSDTYSDGGPQLIYDHQMCFDPSAQTLYVFGGRVLTVGFNIGDGQFIYSYSGLYAYHCVDRQWTCLRPDHSGGVYPHDLQPRMAHTMLFHPGLHQLFIMGGQRDRHPLSDMMVYDVSSDETTTPADGRESHIPACGFTLRTTIDPHRNEIYMLTGLNKFEEGEGPGGGRHSPNSLWVCNISSNRWNCVFQGQQGAWQQAYPRLPAPRYAHQLIYDSIHQVHYMFGGNPGEVKGQHNMRLDDFWRLKLVRQTKEQLLRHCQFILRKQKFDELAQEEPVKALGYLQTSIAAIVNHDDPQESAEFRRLTSVLFASPAPSSSVTEEELKSLRSRHRNKLFDDLSSILPDHMTQPRASILDMVKL